MLEFYYRKEGKDEKKNSKRIAKVLTIALAASLAGTGAGGEAAPKPKLSKTKLTLEVGKKAKLKVKNWKKKVSWASSKKAVAAVKKGVVSAKKKGKTVITAKAGKKKLRCTVTVKAAKAPSSGTAPTQQPQIPQQAPPTPYIPPVASQATRNPDSEYPNYNADDVAALKKIIAEQKAAGAAVSEDLDSGQYTWDAETGRLTGIAWSLRGLSGKLDVTAFASLTDLACDSNQLSELDASGCLCHALYQFCRLRHVSRIIRHGFF